jgi:nicotinamide-nucleotide amidase
MPSQLIIDCCKKIAEKNWKIAFVESATGGRMCAEFALVEGSGEILRGGLSCYEVFVKENILKVPHELIEQYTPESAEVTESLAVHACHFFKTDIVVAVTGLVSPGGSETPEKPVGTMFLHIILPEKDVAHREVFNGSPEEIVLKTVDKAAKLIQDAI